MSTEKIVYQNIYGAKNHFSEINEYRSAYHNTLTEALRMMQLSQNRKNYLRTEKVLLDEDGNVISKETVNPK